MTTTQIIGTVFAIGFVASIIVTGIYALIMWRRDDRAEHTPAQSAEADRFRHALALSDNECGDWVGKQSNTHEIAAWEGFYPGEGRFIVHDGGVSK